MQTTPLSSLLQLMKIPSLMILLKTWDLRNLITTEAHEFLN